MSRRSGVTLVEVLVAIFVMGIGLIALLTLFPIGILRMGVALRDERSAQAARNADAVEIFQNIRNDPSVVSALPGTLYPPTAAYDGAANYDMFANPWPTALKPADPYGESYPLFVDPIGYSSGGSVLAQQWVGNTKGVLRRRPVSFATTANPVSLYANFTLWDDLVFEGAMGQLTLPGTPQKDAAGVNVLRNTRFSWGYTMRRPLTSDKTVVESSIVVFDGRSLSITPGGSLPEHVYSSTANPAQPVYFNPANSTIIIDYTALGIGPPIRPGDWIMDATPIDPTGTIGGAHAYWYRVVASEDIVLLGKTYARYEVQQPIRGFDARPGQVAGGTSPNTLLPNAVDPTSAGAAYSGTLVFLENVAAVFDKGPARLP